MKGLLMKKKYITTNISVDEIILPGQPINYLRERSGRNHFYNPRAKELVKTKKAVKDQLPQSVKDQLYTFREDPDRIYYVQLKIDYYVPTPKTFSKIKKELAENKFLRPDKRPDLDNYDKFIIDAMHDVFYDDDKRVVSLNVEKYYSMEPRTVIKVTYILIDEE